MSILARLAKASDARRLALAAAAVVCLIVSELARRKRLRPRGVTIVHGHWLFGIVPDFMRSVEQRRVYDYITGLHQAYGRTFAVKIPFTAWNVKTTCPKNLEHILKTNFQNYPKGPTFQERLQDLLGGGIFNADGHEWHQQRKVSSHMFTATLFKEHIWVVVRRNARKLRDILESSDPEKPVDVFDLMNRFTLDTVGEIGFGKCIGSLEDPSSPFLTSFDKAQQIVFHRFHYPFWRVMRFFRVGSESETREHMGRLDGYSRSIVRELCCAFNGGSGKSVGWADIEARKSFVALFLEDAKKRGETLSEDYLRDLVLNFLIAGRDTTSQALSWTIYCLSQHPQVEATARSEIIDVCGVRGPTYDDLPRLPYLHAVLSEVLRLYPSVPTDCKKALYDDIWPDGTFVAGGTSVDYDIYSMGRDPSIWGEDAMDFRPERWFEMKNKGNYEYPVFNAGPRECLGRRLAMVEMKTCLAMLLPQVSFQLAVPSSQITPNLQLTIGMAQGLPCFIRSAVKRERRDSNVSTATQSECDTAVSEITGASSEAEKTDGDETDLDSHLGASIENANDSASSSSSRRVRSKKRTSGWSRKRQTKFWQRVREATPERWPTA